MLRLQHKLHDDDDESVAVAQAKTVLAQALVKVPALDEALPLLNSALNAHVSKGRHGDRLRVANLLCHVYRTGGRLEDAEILLKESIAACVEKDGAQKVLVRQGTRRHLVAVPTSVRGEQPIERMAKRHDNSQRVHGGHVLMQQAKVGRD